jgi:NADH-quinone oxidoreductase subunit E
VSFFADKAEFLAETFAKYPPDRKRSAIMPLLRRVQQEEGYVSEERIEEIASLIESTATEVKSVMSFYSAYSDVPTGKYHIQVCMTLSCALAGANQMWDYLEETLGIAAGEVTPDGLFSIARVECLGSCGTAPMLQVSDSSYFERMTRKRLDALLADLKARGDGFVPENDVPSPVYIKLSAEGVSQVAADGRVVLAAGSAPSAPTTAEGGAA